MTEYIPPGYSSRDEYIDDLHEQLLSQMSGRNRLLRWWRINWPALSIPAALLVAVLALWACSR